MPITPEQLLELATKVGIAHHAEFGGMASVSIQYHPYHAHWEAQASWSRGNTITVVNDYSSVAMELLEQRLLRLLAAE